MTLFLGYLSALEFWRCASRRDAAATSKVVPKSGVVPTAYELADARVCFGTSSSRLAEEPFTLVVADHASRRNALAQCRIWTVQIPEKSFMRVKNASDVYVASPEACFVQLAADLSLVQLVKLGFELCGSYAIQQSAHGGFTPREPLTSVDALARYLEKADGLKGVKRARQALRYIANNSASPAETKICMLLCFPAVSGGFGLPLPTLNHRIDPTRSGAPLTSRQHFRLDLYWPQIRTAIEYDSELFHATDHRQSGDASRRNALEAMGHRVITLTKGQLFDANEFERVASIVMRQLKRHHKSECSQVLSKRYALRQEVLYGEEPGITRAQLTPQSTSQSTSRPPKQSPAHPTSQPPARSSAPAPRRCA